MKIRALLKSSAGEVLVGYLTTESSASSYGLAVFEYPFSETGEDVETYTLNRGDLAGATWRLEVLPEDRALAAEQPAWRGILAPEAR
jgi:hypothetical protein